MRGTPATGDQGADLIAKKDGRTIIVQAKCYQSTVGNKAAKADTKWCCEESPLLTQSGHRTEWTWAVVAMGVILIPKLTVPVRYPGHGAGQH